MRRPPARRSAGRALAVLASALALATAMATNAFAVEPVPARDATRLLRQDGLAVSSASVKRVAVHAPGQYVSEVLAVFELPMDRLTSGLFGFDGERLRPFLLGGRTELALPSGRTVGRNLPGADRAAALQIGGGAELRLVDQLFLRLDWSELLHSGALETDSNETWRLGLLLDF